MTTQRTESNCVICRMLEPGKLPKRYEVVHRFEHSLAVLHPVQLYRGHCELWLGVHQRELFDLKAKVRRAFLEEMNVLAAAVFAATGPRKMNYELLGNVVPHLHWHVVPRYETDPLTDKPIWVDPRYARAGRRFGLSPDRRKALATQIREEIIRLRKTPEKTPGQ